MQLIKYLQAQGFGSRKYCQMLIHQSAVKINSIVKTQSNENIDENNIHTLSMHGTAITPLPMPYFYIRMNKPIDMETSHKPTQYPSIFSLFPYPMNQVPMQAIGRLDADTTGIILITNDGQFNHRMSSPKYKQPKIYQVTLKHPADETLCNTLQQGVLLHDDAITVCAKDAYLENPTTLILTITEGKYHQVKRMIAAAGNRVVALHRRQIGSWTVHDLPTGAWRFFQPKDDGL